MFDYIEGTVDSSGVSHVVLDVGGIGFEILSDSFTLGSVQKGNRMRLYTQLRQADDRMTLYGFGTRQQKDLFNKLTTIAGVGPKMALAVLSKLRAEDLVSAILLDDAKALQGVSGVGKKIAQRILLEMRGKVDVDVEGGEVIAVAASSVDGAADPATEAILALEELGFTRQEAAKAVASVRSLGDTAEDLVRLALSRQRVQ